VPTANQPGFLETALQSIARQTAAKHIEEVLVSENLMNRESEAVCRRFKDLPIKYLFQDPPMAPADHFNFLFSEARGDVIAVLCDDDWWSPGHLCEAAVDLKRNENAVARFSACVNVDSQTVWTGEMSPSSILWLAASRPGCCETWRLEKAHVLAAAWIVTPFHASSMVVHRTILQPIVPALHNAHIYQNDRILQVRLAMQGTVLYEPLPDTFIRSHVGAATHRIPRHERNQVFQTCTEMIRELSVKAGIDLATTWHAALVGANEAAIDGAAPYFRMALDEKMLRTCGFDQLILPKPWVRVLRKVRSVAKNRWRQHRLALDV
jgi:hypothetical protein